MMIDAELIALRRAFRLDSYCTLADVGMDGDYVSPLQIASNSPAGPVLLAYNWLDAASARKHHEVLRERGYLPGILFNKVVDRALAACGLTRADVYMTQAFHLLPPVGRSSTIPAKHLDASFNAITRHELKGRKVIAMGADAAGACKRNGVPADRVVDHPSARGPGCTVESKARELASAIQAVLR